MSCGLRSISLINEKQDWEHGDRFLNLSIAPSTFINSEMKTTKVFCETFRVFDERLRIMYEESGKIIPKSIRDGKRVSRNFYYYISDDVDRRPECLPTAYAN